MCIFFSLLGYARTINTIVNAETSIGATLPMHIGAVPNMKTSLVKCISANTNEHNVAIYRLQSKRACYNYTVIELREIGRGFMQKQGQTIIYLVH